jgi:hypothetical protein
MIQYSSLKTQSTPLNMIYNIAEITTKVIDEYSCAFYSLALEFYRCLISRTIAALRSRYIPIFVFLRPFLSLQQYFC